MHPAPKESLLSLESVSKRFGSTHALNEVSLHFSAGRIHALIGENGAGKVDAGEDHRRRHAAGPGQGIARREGGFLPARRTPRAPASTLVHQELALLPFGSVSENVFLGHEISGASGLSWSVHERRTGICSPPSALTSPVRQCELSTAQQQMVEIARAILRDFAPAHSRRAHRGAHPGRRRKALSRHPRSRCARVRHHLHQSPARGGRRHRRRGQRDEGRLPRHNPPRRHARCQRYDRPDGRSGNSGPLPGSAQNRTNLRPAFGREPRRSAGGAGRQPGGRRGRDRRHLRARRPWPGRNPDLPVRRAHAPVGATEALRPPPRTGNRLPG